MSNRKYGPSSLMRTRRGALPALVIIYIVIALIAIFFNAGASGSGVSYSAWVASMVPSINETAKHVEAPQSVLIVLAISWSLIPFCYFLMLWLTKWKEVDWGGYDKKRPTLMIFFALVFVPSLTWFFFSYAPDPSLGRLNKLLFFAISEFEYFVIIYGLVIWLTISALFFCLTMELFLFFRKISNHRGE